MPSRPADIDALIRAYRLDMHVYAKRYLEAKTARARRIAEDNHDLAARVVERLTRQRARKAVQP
jgi:hypothetical protein